MGLDLPDNVVLDEHEAKEMAAEWGVGIPSSIKVGPGEGVGGMDLAYPLVMKVCGTDYIHKTELGGVHLNISNFEELEVIHREMADRFPEASFLVEEQVQGGVEMIIGLVDDQTFGHVIMVGMGGVLTELLRDVVFLSLPVTRNEVEMALDDLKGGDLLKGFRGIEADRESFIELVCSVADAAWKNRGSLIEMDLNPVIVNKDGATAVDVKIVMKG